jgi:hypothetical protein
MVALRHVRKNMPAVTGAFHAELASKGEKWRKRTAERSARPPMTPCTLW